MAVPDRPPTLKTVADLTGLSLSTVSLCLRDGGSVKPETREKVRKVAAEIGYVPNRAGVRLRTGKTNVLALVLAANEHLAEYTHQLIHGIGSRIEGTSFHLNVVPEFAPSDLTGSVRYILENRSADGVILTHTSARDPRVQMLMDAGLPFVSHGRTEFYAPHAFHDFDSERAVCLAVDRLAAKGRRKFLLVVADNGTTNMATIMSGFMRATSAAGVVGEIAGDIKAIRSTKGARDYAARMPAPDDHFDAIICNNELTALSIIGGLQDRGIRLGAHYDLISKQTTEILPTLFPTIDTIEEDLRLSGHELASLLIRLIQGEAPDALQTFNAPNVRWRDPRFPSA